MTYFDHNATTPLLPEARQAWLEAADQFMGNPSSPHRLGARADQALDQARAQLAGFLGCDPLDIIWTSSATESNNLILHHLARTLPADARIWVSALEHPCVLQAARRYFPDRHQLIPAGPQGVADLDWIRQHLESSPPAVLALMAANNETGVIQPWETVRDLCRERGIRMFCDAAQWLGKMPSRGLGWCDFVSGCAHKFGGPKGVGFAMARELVQPLLVGGPQEDGRRAGTENVPGVLSMVAALARREAQLQAGEHRPREAWKQNAFHNLLREIPGLRLTASGNSPSLWNTLSILLPETDCRHRWVVKMDKAGYAVSTGSACSSGKEEPSHVLRAMGLSPDQAARVLRISGGWESTGEDWRGLAEALAKVYREMKAA